MIVNAALQEAISLHQLGRLAEAERLYNSILHEDPNHADALHLLGVMACKSGRLPLALDYITKAIASLPNAPEYYNSLGVVHQRMGNETEAVGFYLRAIELKTDYIEPYNNLLRLNPDAADVRFNLAIVLHRLGRLEEAVTHYSKVVEVQPNHSNALNNLGCALRDLERFDEAIVCLRQAVQQQPEYAEAHGNLGHILQEKGMLEEAITCYQTALSLQPTLVSARTDFGTALQLQGHSELAIEQYQKALEVDPCHAKAYYNWACALANQGLGDEAAEKYAEANRCDPSYVNAHVNRAFALLDNDRYLEGWPEYEWRLQRPDWQAANSIYLELPRWDGSVLLDKTILVQAEQGFGDTIQFVRYLPLVKERCAKLILEVQLELHSLLETNPVIDELVQKNPENAHKADAAIHIMSLPGVFGTTVETIPGGGAYLRVPETRTEKWQKRIPPKGFKIGVAWSGNPAHPENEDRSFQPSHFTVLASIPSVRLFSLQKGAAAEQLIGCDLPIVDLGPELNDFADTAAAIMQLDLVVSVDTSLVHLAGALGWPIWTLRYHVPYWVWGQEGSETPWYPSMRIFRQQKAGDWGELFARVAAEVKNIPPQSKKTF